MPADRFALPTRYEMLLAAERDVQRQAHSALKCGSPQVLKTVLEDWQELAEDIKEYEAQMLGLWRLTRQEGGGNA